MKRRKSSFSDLQRLTEAFRTMGARDPESWARSQLEEGIPQWSRFIFLHQAWKNVISETDLSWIDSLIDQSERHPRDPGSGAGSALKRMLGAGVAREDLTELVREMQWVFLANLAYQLSDPSVVDYPSEELPRVNWKLFEVNEDDEPLHPIGMLHESVLDTDPTGREMRPKGVA